MNGTLTLSSSQEGTFIQGSIILTPKRTRNGMLKNPGPQRNSRETTHQEIFAWTLTSEATAQCCVRDVHRLKESDKGSDFFWLERIPCRNVKVMGLVVAITIYEKRIIYTVDDGTGLLDCAHNPEEHKAKKQKMAQESPRPPQDPIPVAVVGDFVKVVGRVIPKYGSRQLAVSDIGCCKSPNDELIHHQQVQQLHRSRYSGSDPFVVPEVKHEPKVVTPKLVIPPTPVQGLASSPEPPSSPLKPVEVAPASPHRLRHPARLRSADLTANTFRIYLKHYMDYDRPSSIPYLSGEDDEDPFALTLSTPKQRDQGTPRASSSRIHRPLIEPLSLPGLRSTSSVFVHDKPSSQLGYTISYLRRVPELAFLAKRVLRHEIRAKVRKAREAKGKGGRGQMLADQMKPSRKEVKRLFTRAIMQLYREGSIIIWTGPKRPLGELQSSETSCLWKASTDSTLNDTSGGNSTTLYGTSKSAIVPDLDDEVLSDPEPHEESYIPLKIPYLAERVAEVLPKAKELVRKTARADMYYGATAEQIGKFLKRDDQWTFLRHDSIEEALEHLEQRSRAWCPAKGQWDLTKV